MLTFGLLIVALLSFHNQKKSSTFELAAQVDDSYHRPIPLAF